MILESLSAVWAAVGGTGNIYDTAIDKSYIFKGFRCRLVKNDPTSRATPLLLVAHEKFI